MKNDSKSNTRFTTLALLVSIELVLGLTPLGFLAIPPVSITTMHIPVIIGAIILGPTAGGVLGLAFGLISMYSAITGPSLSPVNLLFSPFASVVPRMLLGIIPAYIDKLLRKLINNQPFTAAISAGIATVCHTILVLGCMAVFFKALVIKEIFITIISLNGTVEILAAVIIVPAIALPLKKYVISRGKLAIS